jgi:hypothetical protein
MGIGQSSVRCGIELTGISETYADARHFDALEAPARSIEGADQAASLT